MKRNKVKNSIGVISAGAPAPPATNPINGNRTNQPTAALQGAQPISTGTKMNLAHYIAPQQLQRLRQNVRDWRDSVREAEFAYYPQRVKMQNIFRDVAQEGHVKACTQKRERLSTLREFEIVLGETVLEDLTKTFKLRWFNDAVRYILAANMYGYTLFSLGSIIDSALKSVKLIQRWHVSPDRYNVTPYLYAQTGKCFLDEDVADWHIYVDTASEDGQSPCGYGLFYPVAIYAILLRNNLGYNADFVERFSMPYVVGKTQKTNEDERGQLELAISNMGSAGYAIVDPMDEIEFLEAALAGTGWNGYDNLEKRLQKLISKILLGHADAMDSTPGKLGAGQDGETSPVHLALEEVKTEDGRLICEVVNEQILPKMRKLGLNIPEGAVFRYKNDKEKEAIRKKEDENNKATAEVAKTLADAGFDVSPEYLTKRTGIPLEKKEAPEPREEPIEATPMSVKTKNKLKQLYTT